MSLKQIIHFRLYRHLYDEVHNAIFRSPSDKPKGDKNSAISISCSPPSSFLAFPPYDLPPVTSCKQMTSLVDYLKVTNPNPSLKITPSVASSKPPLPPKPNSTI